MQILIKPVDKVCDHNLTFANKIEKIMHGNNSAYKRVDIYRWSCS
jgi:hypothetical protein